MSFAKRLTATAALVVAMTATAHAETLKVDGTSSEVAIGGTGEGTVVLESGFGDGLDPWKPLLPVIGKFAHTFAYSRLGYGRSGPAMKDPTPIRIANHLHALLVASRLPRPWTLVGHSLGGTYVMTFARLYPDDVGAIVLVDPAPPSQILVWKERIPSLYRTAMTITAAAGGVYRDEMRASEKAAAEFQSLGQFPKVPVFLLHATKFGPNDAPETQTPQYKAWRVGAQRDLMNLSPCPVERDVPDASHYIQRDQPKAVLVAIYEAVRKPRC